MSDAGSGGAPAAPEGGGEGGATSGAGLLAPAAPATPPAHEAGEAAPPPAAPEGFAGSFEGDAREFVTGKGWKGPDDMLASYRALEGMVGSPERALQVPGDPDDQEAWGAVYDRMGRPESSEAYTFGEYEIEEGGYDLTPAFREAAYERGLSQSQAASLHAWYMKQGDDLVESQAAEMQQQSEIDIRDLRAEWGRAYDERVQLGQLAARTFRLDEETLQGLETGVGTKRFLTLMANLGEAVGEARGGPSDGGAGSGFGTTPAQATEQIAALQADPAWREAWLGGSKPHKDKMSQLHRIQAGEES